MTFDIKAGIDKMQIGFKRQTKPEKDELIAALNCFVEIFDVTSKPYKSIILVAISRLSEIGIEVQWDENKKTFKRGG